MNYKINNPGAVESPKDSRDFLLGKIQAPVDIPAVFLPDISAFPIYYQKQQPACGGHAGASFLLILDYLTEGEIRNYSPRFVYALCKKFDGYAGEGTYLRQILKTLKDFGDCDLNLHPNDVDLDPDTYKDSSLISQAAYDNAHPRIIKSYAMVDDLTMAGLKQSIYQNKAVILLMNIGNEFWTNKNGVNSWQEADIMPLRPPQNPVGGHFVVAYGYDTKYIYFINSFSKEWGRSGIGYFDETYLPHIREAGTGIGLSDTIVKAMKTQISLLRTLIELYLKYIAYKKSLTP